MFFGQYQKLEAAGKKSEDEPALLTEDTLSTHA